MTAIALAAGNQCDGTAVPLLFPFNFPFCIVEVLFLMPSLKRRRQEDFFCTVLSMVHSDELSLKVSLLNFNV